MIMTAFFHYKSTKRLRLLAENPFDLTNKDTLTPERIKKLVAGSCGFKLLFGTERVDENILKGLEDLAQEAKVIEKMKKMQSGEVMNQIIGFKSENRAVLHTAVRDFFDNPNHSKETKLAKAEVDKLQNFIEEIDRENKFEEMIVVGIGGSELGSRANYLALKHIRKEGRHVHFVSNVDPDDAVQAINSSDLKKCLVVVVSKSGTTLETATNEYILRNKFKEAGLNPNDHFISVTGKGSFMDDPGIYRNVFYIWDWVGGRFSCSSMVGAVMIAFTFGFDVYMEFLRGANAMDKAALNPDMYKNLPLMAALLAVWNHNFLGYPTYAIVPYSQALQKIPAHVQQVEMESNGKGIDRHGHRLDFQSCPIVWGSAATNAQHSFFQLLHQGTEIVPIEFIAFKESCYKQDIEYKGTTSQEKLISNLFAQCLAFASGKKSDHPNKTFLGNRPSHIILGKSLSPYSLGVLVAFFEHKTAFQGFIWDINSFDQEGVQLGKVLAAKFQKLFSEKRSGEIKEPYPLGEAFLDILN